jgi:hypothetical protein
MAARASAVRGMRVVYDKVGVDPCKCQAVCCTAAHHCKCIYQRRRRPLGRLHNRTGEDASPERSDRNADAHLKRQVMSREVVVAVTNGRLDGFALFTRTFGTWERIFYGEFDGRRRKRVLVKIIGE